MSATRAIRRSGDVAVVDSGDRLVLLDLAQLAKPEPIALEGTAREIWLEIPDAGIPVDAVVASLAARFEAPVRELRSDVEAFVNALVERGLLIARDA
ncbi:PqqD family protein [Rathayibacter sp. YIM 133350]|uniref:PqqD family protein n=1 Tax=Rathayibacter sp. YIM 133350 TaxID=3131992 RepID=UPI00307D2F07